MRAWMTMLVLFLALPAQAGAPPARARQEARLKKVLGPQARFQWKGELSLKRVDRLALPLGEKDPARGFVRTLQPLLWPGLELAVHEVRVEHHRHGDRLSVRLAHKGLPILGIPLVMHLDAKGLLSCFSLERTDWISARPVPEKPISDDRARMLACTSLKQIQPALTCDEVDRFPVKLMYLPGPDQTLVPVKLVKFSLPLLVGNWGVILDAATGKVITASNRLIRK